MFSPKKLIFLMEGLAHVIAREYKAGVVDGQYDDESLDTSSTRAKMNKAVSWTNKSQKGGVDLVKTQKYCKLTNVCLLAPDKTCFSYILHSFKIPIINKDTINYMYGPMSGVGNDINTCKPSYEDWEVVHVAVHAMKEVVAIVHKNELVGRRWLLLDAFMDIVGI